MSIRTTVTLDEDVMESVKRVSRERGVPFRDALNDLIRLGYGVKNKPQQLAPLPTTRLGCPRMDLNLDKVSLLLEQIEGSDGK